MERAAVVIGVSRTGGLPALAAVQPCVEDMVEWATEQGFAAVKSLSDEDGDVTIDGIQTAVEDCLQPGTLGQLVVYFAGHGVNIGGNEFWLLSKAPRRASEAVNVAGSVVFAKRCGVPHVVVVSDACRTAAAAETACQSVQGASIFPNLPPTGRRTYVDRFYACLLGSPALEVPSGPSRPYQALYTTALVEALRGEVDGVIEPVVEDGRELGLVRPEPLGEYLSVEVGRRLALLDPSGDLIQNPDADISSRAAAFMARFDPRPAITRSAGPAGTPPRRATVATVARAAVHEQLFTGGNGLLDLASATDVPGVRGLAEHAERAASAFGPEGFVSQCGIKVRGTVVVSAEGRGISCEILGDGSVRMSLDAGRSAADALLRFDNGTCAVIPALAGFVAALTVNGRELVDVSYDPVQNSPRMFDYGRGRLDRLRGLRGVVSAASRVGAFRLTDDDIEALARQMQVAKGIDPSLAIYAAYAYADLRRTDRLVAMSGYLAADVGATLFDVALLAGQLGLDVAPVPVTPMMPMLAKGWALLEAYGARVAEPVHELRHTYLVPSLWTLFDERGSTLALEAVRTAGRTR